MKTKIRPGKTRRGGVLISALAFTVIAALMMAGMATVAMSYYARARTEADYQASLALAEAGINYEFRKVSLNTANADQTSVANPNGVTYNLGSGTFRVYCTNQNGSTPWVPPSNLYVVSEGTINGVTRTVKVSGKSYSTLPNYALFGVQSGIMNGSPTTVGGDVGTNGYFTFNGHPTVSGYVQFNGAGSGWQSPPNGSYNTVYNPSAVVWPTVSTIANQTVAGGLATLATTNDNALANPPIVGNNVLVNGAGTLTLRGKPGGANYYVSSLILNGAAQIVFDNSAGPINIWEGPAGSSSSFIFNGGSAAIRNSIDSSKKVSIYVATNNDVIMNGNTELDAGVYNYNGASSGTVIMNGSPVVYGPVIGNKFIMNGNPQINYQTGFFNSSAAGYYGFNDRWIELNGM